MPTKSQYPFEEISFTASDGFTLNGAFYRAENSKRLLIIGSAFGVPFQYYKHIAHYLRQNGINVLTFDYRGISHSKNGNMATTDILMQHWGELDIEAAIAWATKEHSPDELYYMGHSAGGQILGLAQSSPKFSKVIIAASGVGTWHVWPGIQKYFLASIWYLAFPLIKLFQKGDYFHSKMLGPIPVPKNAVNQWLRWARSEDYLFSPEHKQNLDAYKKINAELLALTISDDWYAPVPSRDALVAHYENCNQQKVLIKPEKLGLKSIGHFGLFKKKQEIEQGIWQPILNFLNGTNNER